MMEKTLSNGNAVIGSGFNWLSGALETVKRRYEQHRVYRQTVRELSELSDRALADLGVSRSMIKALARESAYGN